MTVFDSYVMVDWSAAQSPRSGVDSIWIYALDRHEHGVTPFRVANPPTRLGALTILIDVISDFVARGRTTLVGFDFAFGYPVGFAERIRPQEPNWRGVWKQLAARIRDHEDNTNNRFQVAASLNEELSGTSYPFWGCPEPKFGDHLSARKPSPPSSDGFDEFRVTDRAAGPAQSVWKLYYPGCVGSQTLLGIPYVHRLRHHPLFEETSCIWPFETGLRPLERPSNGDPTVYFAEIYPSLLDWMTEADADDEPKDLYQIRCVAHHFARLDTNHQLAPLFAGSLDLDPHQKQQIEREEGWILGVVRSETHNSDPLPSRYDYIRDPQQIYDQSFSTIRDEADLDAFTPALANVVVRLIHACGDVGLTHVVHASEGAAIAARSALRAGAPILVDTEMTAAGIIRKRLPRDNSVLCFLGDPSVPEIAKRQATTRSSAAVDLWQGQLDGAVIVIGNAPTALFRLLELIDQGAGYPAVILAFPVGFVGAAESKEALIDHPMELPHITVRGRRGGSAMAAAAVNALASDAH